MAAPRRFRAPGTLWVYVSLDLWRLVLLTAVVLVTVIAFAPAVKFMADGKLGPLQTLKFMLFAMLPMLQYALPFAACFGATLAYHRLAADNETLAAHAGGISHKSLLLPSLASGLVLAVTLLALSNMVIPRFLRKMEDLITKDAAQLIVSTIQRGDALELEKGKRLIYADDAVPADVPAGSNYQALRLLGLMALELDDAGHIVWQGSARTAAVWIRPFDERGADGSGGGGSPATEVTVRANEASVMHGAMQIETSDVVRKFVVPTTFRDDPKFMSAAELRGLRSRPERVEGVDKKRRALAMAIAERETIDAVRDALKTGDTVRMVDPLGDVVTVRAKGIRAATDDKGERIPGRFQFVPEATGRGGSDSGVIVVVHQGRTITAEHASLSVEAELRPEEGERVVMNLSMENARVSEPGGNTTTGKRAEYPLRGLRLGEGPASDILGMPSTELRGLASAKLEERGPDRDEIARALHDLDERVDDLMMEATSKEQERLAMSLACLVMVLTGAVMAMRLRESLPLTIYLWAFFPALAAVLTISAGQQMVHKHGLVALPLLWGGVVGLAVLTAVEYLRLVRH